MCKVYTGYYGTSEIEHGLCACTVDSPLATARGLSLRTGAQTILYLSFLTVAVICVNSISDQFNTPILDHNISTESNNYCLPHVLPIKVFNKDGSSKARFHVELSARLAFGTPKIYIATYDTVNYGLVNLGVNCDVKMGLRDQFMPPAEC